MRTTEGDKVAELGLMFLKVRQGSSGDKPAEAVSYKAYFREAVARAVLIYVRVYLLGQSDAHFFDVTFRVVFVG